MCNNSAEAASGARTAAYNLEDIALLLKNVCGIFLIGFGLLSLCHFTMLELDNMQNSPKIVTVEATTVDDVPEEKAIEQTENETIEPNTEL